ncbi:MAG: hypothetical protein IPJ55_16995 [Chloracidobacterium sp.]|nr:hypothetical protein [Chloracidobacterium sp.]
MNNENWKGHTHHQLAWSERYDPHPHIWFEEKKDLKLKATTTTNVVGFPRASPGSGELRRLRRLHPFHRC